MASLPQKLPRLWFTKNIRYFIYFVREFSGVLLAVYFLYLIFALFLSVYLEPNIVVLFDGKVQQSFLRTVQQIMEKGFPVMNWVGFVAALIHTFTWLWVSVKLFPRPLKPEIKIMAYLFLIAVWIWLSYFLLNYFFDPPYVSSPIA